MNLIIVLNKNGVKLEISQKGLVLDLQEAKYYHDLGDLLTPLEVTAIISKGFITRGDIVIYKELLTGLISALDKLLKRNKLTSNTIKSHILHSDLGQDSTSYKIASAFIKGLKASR